MDKAFIKSMLVVVVALVLYDLVVKSLVGQLKSSLKL
jgi:hypothetical protein